MLTWKIKIIAAAVLIAALGGLLWHDNYVTKRLNVVKANNRILVETLDAERKAREHELKIAKEASDGYQAELRRIRAEPSIGSVRICATRKLPATSSAASGLDGSSPRREQEATEVDSYDVGPQLDEYGTDCEATAAQLNALQSWVRSR